MAETLGRVGVMESAGFSADAGAVTGPAGASGPAVGAPGAVSAAADAAGGEPTRTGDGRPRRPALETDTLVRALYAEIRAIAASQLADQWAANSLHPTALANEAVMRILQGVGGEYWESPRHFLGAAAEAMRRVIVDAARRRKALKRGGGLGRIEISILGIGAPDLDSEVLFVNDALDVLAREDEIAAEVFRLRHFGGFTVAEMAEKTGIPRRSVDRRLAYARAWLACRWDDETTPSPKIGRRAGDA